MLKEIPVTTVTTPLRVLVFTSVLVLAYVVIQRFVLFLRSVTKRNSSLFPGPPSDPLIGHARIFPHDYPWKTFAEWGKVYGNLISANVLGRSMLIINSLDDAKELLEKRGLIYSDRPRFVLFQELMRWDIGLVFLRYGERFRNQRKLIQQHWNAQNVVIFRPSQAKETYRLLQNLLETPQNFQKHIERAISAGIMMAAYGYHIQPENDPYVHMVDVATRMSAESGPPGGMMVDFFPLLKYLPAWMPGAGFKRHALKTKGVVQDIFNKPFEMVMRQRADGISNICFMTRLLDDYEKMGLTDFEYEENIKSVSGMLYGAGVETTTASLSTFVFAMVLYPHVAQRAQKEIDEVTSFERLPEFDDRGRLPYTDCILREIYRWCPPVPLGVPHSSMKQDLYKGKIIPKDCMIIPNIWYMMRDLKIFSDPDTFNPDRFSEKKERSNEEDFDADPTSAIFGFGRRICPGRFYADAGIWYTIVCMLACFDILPALDENGNVSIPEPEFTTGSTSQPKPFKCRFVLRNQRCKTLIQEAVSFE